MVEQLKSKINKLPLEPGVYIYKDENGKIIYVGKAKRLRVRVKSYFVLRKDLGIKTNTLVQNIRDLDHIQTQSELEALILEAELIRKYKPQYNIQLKDDKSYLYIVIRKERIKTVNGIKIIFKVLSARRPDLLKNDIVFGPYPDANSVKYVLKLGRKVIPYRDCSQSKFSRYEKAKNPCLYGHIGLCSAPCQSEEAILMHNRDIRLFNRFLSGKTSFIIEELKRKMTKASKTYEYEAAKKYRDIIKKFDYIRSDFYVADKYIENPNLLEDLTEQAVTALLSTFKSLKKVERIECYDISNISGKEAVGSMVVASNGQIDKSEYRKFKIETKDTPDDFQMMEEVLSRRMKKNWTSPDLIVLDGGKGQLSKIVNSKKILLGDTLIVGLAKRLETIVLYDGEKFEEILLQKDNPGLKLLIRLRDEAHRFAQAYHHKLRERKIRYN